MSTGLDTAKASNWQRLKAHYLQTVAGVALLACFALVAPWQADSRATRPARAI